jgi:hypothetical protein
VENCAVKVGLDLLFWHSSYMCLSRTISLSIMNVMAEWLAILLHILKAMG